MANEALTAKGINTRLRILQVARELLIKGGYDSLIMREVAKRADMKLGNLQYYFATRDILLVAIIEAEAEADIKTLQAAFIVDKAPEGTIRKLVNTLLIRWRGESGIVFSTMSFLAMHKPAFRTQRQSVYEAYYKEFHSAVECAEPGLPEQIYQERTRLLTALIDGAAQQIQVGSEQQFFALVADQALAIALPNGASC